MEDQYAVHINCRECGVRMVERGNAHTYCEECSAKRHAAAKTAFKRRKANEMVIICRECCMPIEGPRRRGRPKMTHDECDPPPEEPSPKLSIHCHNCQRKFLPFRFSDRFCQSACRGEWYSELKMLETEQEAANRPPPRCADCGEWQSPRLHPRHERVVCENCTRIRGCSSNKSWRQANPDKLRAKSSSARARKRSLPSEPWSFGEIWEQFSGKCYICHRPCLSRDAPINHPLRAVVDHVKPQARGGPDLRFNLALAHNSCNGSKATRFIGELPSEWWEWRRSGDWIRPELNGDEKA